MNEVKASVVDLNNNVVREIVLPQQFGEELREDLIRRAFHAEQTSLLQPKGVYALAGFQTTAEYIGRRRNYRSMINVGRARLPKEKLPKGRFGRVLRVPQAVKGRRAHPPKPWKTIAERINLKEKNAAVRSAMAATLNKAVVEKRGHAVGARFPLVLDNALQAVSRTSELEGVFERLGLGRELERARKGRKALSGTSRARRGGHRQAKSILIVYGEDKGLKKAARNLAGVDAVQVRKLSAGLLAPGGAPGRLTLWTEQAIEETGREKLFS